MLLCFEDLRQPGVWCHRQIVAAWIEEHLGIKVPELPESGTPVIRATRTRPTSQAVQLSLLDLA